MTKPNIDCRICGWPGMAYYHTGAVDCINAYRTYVEDLQSQLPRGKQVMVCPIERNTTVQMWIDGEITFTGLERLITTIRFMQQAWTEDPKDAPPAPETASTAEVNEQVEKLLSQE